MLGDIMFCPHRIGARLVCALVARLGWAGLALAGLATGSLADDVTVFAAASLKTALDEVTAEYTDDVGVSVTVSYAGSSVLARQIALGAPADVFVSANPDWMDWLAGQGAVQPGTRRDLLGNRLALVVHGDGPQMAVDARLDLAGLVGDGPLAMALVEAVPAGQYGKAALSALGQWDAVAGRVAQTDSVRAALALVALGAAPVGVVYATDALAEPRVTMVGTFPPESHAPIVYPVAAVGGEAGTEARAFIDHLFSPEAAEIFARHGFTRPGGAAW